MINPYLNFKGNAEEAITLYESVFSCSDKKIMRFSEMPPSPEFPITEELKDKILHASMVVEGTTVFFSDIREDVAPGTMLSLSIPYDDAEKLETAYNKILADGGKALMELAPQFYAKAYAWVCDRFGVDWQLICEK